MSAPGADARFPLRRILVALDGSPAAASAAETAARLAARYRAVLEGLYVEDEDLLNLGLLPVSRLVRFPGGQAGGVDVEVLARHMRGESRRVRGWFEAAAGRMGVQARFVVRRGRVDAEIVAAAAQADLLVVGVTGRRDGNRRRAGSVAAAAVEHAPGSVLVQRGAAGIGRRLLVRYDGSAESERALATGAALAVPDGARIEVAIAAEDARGANELRERALRALAALDVRGDTVDCIPPTPARLATLAAERGADAVVIPAGAVADAGARLRLLAEAPCPVLVSR